MRLIAERSHDAVMYNGDGLRLIVDDSRHALTQFPDKYFRACITSPPYWSLRDYGINGRNIQLMRISLISSLFSEKYEERSVMMVPCGLILGIHIRAGDEHGEHPIKRIRVAQ